MTKGFIPLAIALVLLTGCGTASVSPNLLRKEGVITGFNKDGHAVVKSIAFSRSAAASPRMLKCVQTEAEGLAAPPVELDGTVKANGKAYAQLQYSSYVGYVLTIRGDKYTFDRLTNAGTNGPAYELMASSWGTPENAYSTLEGIADRISGCAAG